MKYIQIQDEIKNIKNENKYIERNNIERNKNIENGKKYHSMTK